MMLHLPHQSRVAVASQGVALVAVLWIVAALTILVAGMTQTVRQQIRAGSLARSSVEALAVGDAAIQQTLQSLRAASQRPTALVSSTVLFRAVPVNVTVQPINGLIDIDAAPVPLLQQLLMTAGGLNSGAAQGLADAINDWRNRRGASGQRLRLEAVEDLLQVPGVDYTLFSAIRPLITVETGGGGGGRVNPMAAEADVLVVLSGGNIDRAVSIANARNSGQIGVDTTALNPQFVQTSGNTSRYLVRAEVPVDEGVSEIITRAVVLSNDLSGMPWRTMRVEQSRKGAAPRG